MVRKEGEGACDDALDRLNKLLKQYPQLKASAAAKIEELTTELSLEAKIPEEEKKATESADLSPVAKFKRGFQGFKKRFRTEQPLFKSLAESQHPKYMIFACSDSRVDPALVLGLDVGDAFIYRGVANLVPPYAKEGPLAPAGCAIEYAILHLKVEHIVVMGHSRCGGIKALIGMHDGASRFSEFIEDWMAINKDAPKTAKLKCGGDGKGDPEEHLASTAKASVNYSLFNVLSFPYVKDAVADKKVMLHGAYYDFVTPSFEIWPLCYNIGASEKFD